MKSDGWNGLLLAGTVVPLVLLLWPFAWWGGVMQLLLRVIPALCVQLLLCRLPVHPLLKLLPLLAAGAMAGWGTWLFFTSPSWVNATAAGLVADYVSPFLSCVFAVAAWSAVRGIQGKRSDHDEK